MCLYFQGRTKCLMSKKLCVYVTQKGLFETLLPCEHLSDVAFNVYRVVGVAWQSCSCFFSFFYSPNGPRSGDFALEADY